MAAEAVGELRSRVVPIRFTPAELSWLQESSRELRVSVSEYVRRAAFGRKLPLPPVPSVNRETYQELSRIGNNLSQLMRKIHSGMAMPIDPHMLQELRAMVTSIGLQVIGAAK
ncbi:MAG TPA: plasmid mobilization relaxosome protein MobC [Bdellovibrionota bacterium]|nr:plasmid mobilization relaxosome protein MobC [Bdellovibrionota bacterium]